MNKNTIIGVLLMFAIFIGYTYLVTPSQEELMEHKRKTDSAYMATQAKREADIKAIARHRALAVAREKEKIIAGGGEIDSITLLRLSMKDELGMFAMAAVGRDTSFLLENDLLKIHVHSHGGKIGKVELKDYLTWDKKPLVLQGLDSLRFGFSFFSNNRVISTSRLYFTPIWPESVEKTKVTGNDSLQFGMRAYVAADDSTFDPSRYIEFIYTIRGNDYMLGYRLNMVNLEGIVDPATRFLVMNWSTNLRRLEKSLNQERMNTTLYYKFLDDEVDYLSESKDEEKYLKNERLKWMSFKQQFFTSTIIANQFFTDPKISQITLPGGQNYLKTMKMEAGVPYEASQKNPIELSFYFGPNRYYGLKGYKLDLEKQIPLGWGFFLLAWINIYAVIPVFTFFGNLGWNYGIIILILTVLLKIVLFPIAFKTYKSSAKMRVLKPDVDELAKKFPKQEDAMKKQAATMELYKKAGVNPMAGCVPLLLQMPILIAMFRFFPSSIELRQQAFLWADDLSSYDEIGRASCRERV